MQFNVNYKGDVTLCCNDAYWKCVIGNVRRTPIEKIWYSAKFESIRQSLIAQNRNKIRLCSRCDSFPHGTRYEGNFLEAISLTRRL